MEIGAPDCIYNYNQYSTASFVRMVGIFAEIDIRNYVFRCHFHYNTGCINFKYAAKGDEK